MSENAIDRYHEASLSQPEAPQPQLLLPTVTIVSEYQTLLLHIPRGQSSTCKAVAMSVAMVALVVMTLEHHLTLDKTWKKSDYSTFLELGEPAKQMGSGGESTGLPAT